MENTARRQRIWVSIDFWVQIALLAATAGLYIFSSPFFLLFMAIPIGLWQGLGGLVHWLVFKKSNRKPYLMGVLACGAIFFVLGQSNLMNASAMLLVAPLAVWNFILTARDFYEIADS
jgi:hypothetical protein